MARIRSVHPGFFSDESVVACSFPSRLLLIGLWGEADDNGIFEWKPLSLKMRLMPADNVDLPTLLLELETHNTIRKFTHEGKYYGAVRNFAIYQRPKKPKTRYFMPDEFRTYVGLDRRSSEPDDDEAHPVPKKSEIAPQMEDGGCNRKEERKEENTSDDVSPKYAFESGVIRLNQRDFSRWKASFSHLDVPAELEGLSEWAGGQSNWFHAVKGALAKRNREIGVRKAQQNGRPLTASGNPWPEGIT